MPEQDQQGTGLEEALFTLRVTVTRLRRFSVWVLFATLLNFGLALTVIVIASSVGRHLVTPAAIVLVALPIAGFLLSLGALAMYDQTRRSGNALFDELSDEMEWHIGARAIGAPPRDPPLLAARLLLREYATSTDLWLVPGRLGPGFYALANLGACFFAVFVAALNWPGYW